MNVCANAIAPQYTQYATQTNLLRLGFSSKWKRSFFVPFAFADRLMIINLYRIFVTHQYITKSIKMKKLNWNRVSLVLYDVWLQRRTTMEKGCCERLPVCVCFFMSVCMCLCLFFCISRLAAFAHSHNQILSKRKPHIVSISPYKNEARFTLIGDTPNFPWALRHQEIWLQLAMYGDSYRWKWCNR